MKGFLKGYYGYKNFGDELLLLGVIPYITQQYTLDELVIEVGDPIRLRGRLDRHSIYLPAQLVITCVAKHTHHQGRDILFLGGGEVITDGRPFPYNGRNYLFGYRKTIFHGRYYLLGGVGTPKRFLSKRLRNTLLSNASGVIVREKKSYHIVQNISPKTPLTQRHDFALDILDRVSPPVVGTKNHFIINVNPYIWNDETKEKIRTIVAQHPGEDLVYFPAEIGTDDRYRDTLQEFLGREIQLFDRTKHTIGEICQWVQHSQGGISARLHILLLFRYFKKPFTPLVYQEKISTFLETCSEAS